MRECLDQFTWDYDWFVNRMFDVFCDTYGEEKSIELCMA